MDFTFAAAQALHIPLVCEIMRETVSALSQRDYFVPDDEAYVERHIEREGFTLLAWHQSECAGFLITDIPGLDERNLGRDLGWPDEALEKCAHIDSVCVRPAFRGHGLQKRLGVLAEQQLKDMGVESLLATVHPDNAASLRSMLALGFRIGATKAKYGGLPRHILFKPL